MEPTPANNSMQLAALRAAADAGTLDGRRLNETMSEKHKLAEIPPLPIGRISRILFGITTFVIIGLLGVDTLGFLGVAAIGALGLSFVIGGIFAIPGCEITAIPNLLLPRSMRFHFP